MTPRQLWALAELHREIEGGPQRNAAPAGNGRRTGASAQGGAGWLMAVSQGLERNRPRKRVNALPSAPGVG